MAPRSAEDCLAGVLRIAVGGVEKIVPTLPIKATREWQQAITTLPGRWMPADPDDWTPEDASAFSGITLDVILDVVTSYDRTGALGGREWLEEHADPAQLYAAADQMVEVAFPFADNRRVLLSALVARSVLSAPLSSTSGPSPIGASRRRSSRRPSTRAS